MEDGRESGAAADCHRQQGATPVPQGASGLPGHGGADLDRGPLGPHRQPSADGNTTGQQFHQGHPPAHGDGGTPQIKQHLHDAGATGRGFDATDQGPGDGPSAQAHDR